MKYFEQADSKEKAILVHCTFKDTRGEFADNQNDLDEFRLLAISADTDILDEITGTMNKPHAKYFVGTGKADEIAQKVAELEAQIVLFNHTLTPSQERNLEKILQCKVVDRTGLILDIFAKRARTYEGKLQVELAQLTHLSSRLVRGYAHLGQQKGGIGLRGPGETQLETDRRLLQVRVQQLKAKLEKIKQTRKIGRSRRQKSQMPTISLVGYTNAGKSTLFNALTGDNAYAANQLFATLDPTIRQVNWAGVGEVVLSDTVGFVKNLNHDLVESFHATLEETLEADLLLHVVDTASENALDEMAAVTQVLSEIKADAPVLLVHNKIDKSGDTAGLHYADVGVPHRVYISAATGLGMDKLTHAVTELLGGQLDMFHVTIDHHQGGLANALHSLSAVTDGQFDETGRQVLSIQLPKDRLRQLLGQFHIDPADVLPKDEADKLALPLESFEQPTFHIKDEPLDPFDDGGDFDPTDDFND